MARVPWPMRRLVTEAICTGRVDGPLTDERVREVLGRVPLRVQWGFAFLWAVVAPVLTGVFVYVVTSGLAQVLFGGYVQAGRGPRSVLLLSVSAVAYLLAWGVWRACVVVVAGYSRGAVRE